MFGLLATALIAACNLLFIGLTLLGNQFGKAIGPAGLIAEACFLMIVEIYLIFAILKRTFALSWQRTLGLFVSSQVVEVAFGFGLAIVVRTYLVEAYVMPTGSMAPTIIVGDRFTVLKVAAPRRWDLIAYWNGTGPERAVYCKRVLGLPGEQIKFQGGDLYVNGEKAQAPEVTAGQYHASLGEGFPSPYQDGQTIRLGTDQIFVVGDNVEKSKDSRFDGPSKISDIVGVVETIYWPLSRVRILR